MVQPVSSEDHLSFVLSCLQCSVSNGGKIDYDAIAKAHGMTKSAAYFRLYSLKKKGGFGAGGAKPLGQGNRGTGQSTMTASKKRGRSSGFSQGAKPKKQNKGSAATAKFVNADEEDADDDSEEDAAYDSETVAGDVDNKVEVGKDSDVEILVKEEFENDD